MSGALKFWDGSDWRYIASTGPQGPPGEDGADGVDGADGAPGATGAAGATGPAGSTGATGAPGADGSDGADGADGADGPSAYQVAVDEGFVGTEADWLESLVGPEGPEGPPGDDGATVYIDDDAPVSPFSGELWLDTDEDTPAMNIPPMARPKLSGVAQWSIPGCGFTSVSTGVLTANTRYYSPFVVWHPIEIDALGCEVTSAGTLLRMGILACDEDLTITGVEIDSGDITASLGVKTFTLSGTHVLQAGTYLSSIQANASTTMRALRGGSWMGAAGAALGTNSIVLNLRGSVTFGAYDTTAWTAIDTATVGWNFMTLLRVSDPTP